MKFKPVLVIAVILCTSVATARAQDLSGTYAGPKLSVDLVANGGGYSGTIRMANQQFPLTAQAQGGQLQGSFASGGNRFPFTATIAGDEMTLVSANATYSLRRQQAAAAENPLAPANPLAGAAVNAQGDVTELASNRSGKTLFFQKPQATSAQAAIEATLPDLARQLGTRPQMTGAYADQKDPTKGVASFTATVNGQPIAGTILCGRGAVGGEVVTVTYARTDAPPADRAALSAALPGGGVKTQTHQFPDGTGSIDLPEGWTTQNQSVIGGVQVKGPADQIVSLGIGVSVVTPNSTAVQMQRQMEQQAQQMGFPTPPPMQLFVAPYTGPVEAIQNLIPEISKFSQRNNGPAVTLVQMLQSSETQAGLPGGHAALMSYLIDKGPPGAPPVRFKCAAQVETYALGDGRDSWGAFLSELAAPESHFDADIATMWAIAKSFKTNDAVVSQKTQQIMQQNKANFAAFQKSMKDNRDAFDNYRKSMDQASTARDRSNADFIEVIRGYRDVEDTTTGQRTSVDLGHADDVVNKLNEGDPGRYKQIPLRDDLYPQ